MPISSNESSKQSPSQNKAAGGNLEAGAEQQAFSPRKPGGLRIPFGRLVLQIEPRFFVIGLLVLPLYALAAFVGNDWAYMLPCTIFAALIIGLIFPLLLVLSIACSCHVAVKHATVEEQEIILKAWRLPFLGMLSNLIPSGYLNAQLHLMRRTWSRAHKIPAIVPLPVVLQSLSRGIEMRIRVPSLARGIYDVDSLEITTCFPFAMVWWSRRISLESRQHGAYITVLPARKDLAGNFHCRLASTSLNSGRALRNMMLQHRSTSLKGLREFTERDSLNQIHWASSARSGKLLVREFEVESLPDFDVFLNLENKWTDAQLDLACAAAYALVRYGYRSGFTPQLRLNPPLDWGPVAEQLADIPAGLAGEELIAELLARVLPLPAEISQSYKKFKNEPAQTAVDVSDRVQNNSRAVISIVPSEIKKNAAQSILLLELAKSQEAEQDLEASQTLARVESELELARI